MISRRRLPLAALVALAALTAGFGTPPANAAHALPSLTAPVDTLVSPDSIALTLPGTNVPGFGSPSPALLQVECLLKHNLMTQAERFARALLARYDREGMRDSLLVAETCDYVAKAIRIGPAPNRPEAIALAHRALGIKSRCFGEDNVWFARSLTGLASLHIKRGERTAAVECATRAWAIADRHLPPGAIERVFYLNPLAVAHLDIDDTAAAAEDMRTILWIRGHADPPDSLNIGDDCFNYAAALSTLGDLRGAEENYEIALRWLPRKYDAEHPMVGMTLACLADVQLRLGHGATAMASFRRAYDIQRRRLGADHPDVAGTLARIANLEADQGRLAVADSLLGIVIAAFARTMGPSHPVVADNMVDRAAVLERMGRGAEAESLTAVARNMKREQLGDDSFDVAAVLSDLARLHVRHGRTAEAFDEALASETHARATFERIAAALPEKVALRFAGVRVCALDVAMSAVMRMPRAARGERRAWDAVARSRNLVQDESAERHRGLVADTDSATVRLADALRSVTDSLAHAIVRECPDGAEARCRSEFRGMSERRDALEARLAAASATFDEHRRHERAGLDSSLARLPAHAVLVAYVRFADACGSSLRVTPERYAAFIGRRDGAVELVPLAAAARVDSAVARWREAIRAGATGARRARNEARARALGVALRRLVWDPVAAHMGGANRVFLVPDGAVSLVHFDALPAANGSYLAETTPPFHYLASERDLIPRGPATNRMLLAVGGTDFDADPRWVARETSPPAVAAVARPRPFRGGRSTCSGYRDLHFDPLPASAEEVATVADLWTKTHRGDAGAPVVLLTGAHASVTSFERLAPTARVIHLATHGFLLDGECGTADPRRAVLDDLAAEDDPLLLSGLAFAGSNRRDRAAPGNDDGVLTAEEVAALDLGGTEWAVLASCESGVGRVLPREGVLGLPRAFLTAGCRTVLTTLWPVDDTSSQRWVRSLYTHRFRDGDDAATCTRSAALESLRARRRAGASTLPLYWAGFIAIGEAR